jgi:gamma-glutamylcysteine synthetase
MNSFLNSFSSCKINTTGVLATFGRNEKQRKILTKFDEILLNKITPAHWKYICYGIAEK